MRAAISSVSRKIGPSAAFLLALALLLTGCSQALHAGTARSLPNYKEVACDLEFNRLRKAVCGVLTVLENRASGSGREVTIPVVTFLSNEDVTHPDPVVYLPGGPGLPAIFSARQLLQEWPARLANADWLIGRDLIIFDPRGTGMATPSLECPEEKIQLEAASDGRLRNEIYRTCLEKLRAAGIDLSAYHTPALAADLNDLRRVMGIAEWNLWATSYGTRVALEAIRQDPTGIRSVILASPYPPGVEDPVVITNNFDRILNELIATCPLNELCARFGADLPDTFHELLEDLRENPRKIKFYSNNSYSVVTRDVNDVVFLELLFRFTSRHRGLTSLPFTILVAEQGSFSFGGVHPQEFLEFSRYKSLGLSLQVPCGDGMTVDANGVQEASKLLPYLAEWTERFWTKEYCRKLIGPQPPALDPNPVESDLPILLLSGAFDPVTPSQWALDAAESLPNSFVFVFPGASHTVSPLPCARAIMKRFLDDPDRRPSDPCLARLSGPVPY